MSRAVASQRQDEALASSRFTPKINQSLFEISTFLHEVRVEGLSCALFFELIITVSL